jgi:hypothetical protein
MSLTNLVASLSAFDEAALNLLANKGLVRRAQRDVEDGKIALVGFDGQTAQVAADGETVSLDARGPRSATCTCPALGICRHRIAAVLIVQAGQTVGLEDKQADTVAGPEVLIDFAAEIVAISLEGIAKWAGKASFRGAQDLVEETEFSVVQDASALVVTFGTDGLQVRILSGQGLDGIISKTNPATRKAYHAAAMVAARRHFGLAEPEAVVASSEEDLPTSQAIDPVFLEAVGEALTECANVALNIAPISLEERLFALSVSSRADALPRLGAMLRALSKMVRTRRLRDFSFDPDDCLALMADAYAIVCALTNAGPSFDADRLVNLKGKARQDYVGVGDLALVGCGADQWRTGSGARGITGHFYDPVSDTWYSASVARAAGQDPQFDPLTAYRGDAIWNAASLEKLCRTPLVLKDASASQSGRLSAAKNVTASLPMFQAPPQRHSWRCHITGWDELVPRLGTRLTGSLSVPHRVSEPVILAPRRISRPIFDDLTQKLSWAIEDSDGRWITLNLEHGRDKNAVMTSLEAIAESGWTGAIIALASLDGDQFVLRPFALLEKDKLFCLGLDPMPQPPKQGFGIFASRFVADMRERLGRLPRQFAPMPKSTTQTLLSTCWQRLVEMAEIGIGLSRDQSIAQIKAYEQRFIDAGLPQVGAALGQIYTDGKATPSTYFRACYTIRLAQRQLINLPMVMPVG